MEVPGMAPMAPPSGSPLAWGTVGWTTDGGTFVEVGDSSADETGRTLVRVTLFQGRSPTSALDQTQAQGRQILTQLGGGFLHIPLRGTPVLVAIPDVHGLLPGAAIIIAQLDMTGLRNYANLQPGEGAMYATSGQARVLCKSNGTACLFTSRGNSTGGDSVTVQVNADGSVVAAGPYGGMSCTSSATGLAFGSTSGVQCDASGAWMTGPAIGLSSGNVQLGPAPVHPLVLGDLLATQIVAIETWVTALAVVVNSLIPPSGVTGGQLATFNTATGVLATALGIPNISTTCKGSA